MARALLLLLAVAAAQNIKLCVLNPHPSVRYWCDDLPCNGTVEDGARVEARCAPEHYASGPLPLRRCLNGQWDSEPRCQPECGRVTPVGGALVSGGRGARRGELPWHVGIYSTATDPPLQVCGGSIISNYVVLSAAHCFWTDVEKQLPAALFLVAAGKLYRPYNDPKDEAQKSQVKSIHIPLRFQGSTSQFQDDIAAVILRQGFEWRTHIRPVCLSFDFQLESSQLSAGNEGKVAGWGLSTGGRPSPVLQTARLPYIPVGECLSRAPPDFIQFITSDKICAGTQNERVSVCRGDSGGGLTFPAGGRHYLRGVVSTAPRAGGEAACDARGITAFTALARHERFIAEYYEQGGVFRCAAGGWVAAGKHCDGAADCADGSDESAAACARASCSPAHFRCRYGACVDAGAKCDAISDCADGSDEADCDLAPPQCRPRGAAAPLPGYTWERSSRRCYKFHVGPLGWGDARTFCEAEGAALASVGTPEQQNALKQLFKQHPARTLKGTYRDYLAVGVQRINGSWFTDGAPLREGVWSPWYVGHPEPDTATDASRRAPRRVAFMERDGQLENYEDGESYINAPFVCELRATR